MRWFIYFPPFIWINKPPYLQCDDALYLTPSTTPQYLGQSRTSFSGSNHEEEFIANFDEDGSFIGDYLQQEEILNRKIQTQLTGKQNT